MIAALILAAGRSSRMAPKHKLLERIGGVSIIRRTFDAVAASECGVVIVVLGHDAARVAAELPPPDMCPRQLRVPAPGHAAGLSASLRAGMDRLPATATGVVVCLGDMPFVRTGTIDRLIAAATAGASASASAGAIVVPVHEGLRGNPVLWGRDWFASLAGLTGDRGGGALIDRHRDAVIPVAVDDPGIQLDIDDDAALRDAIARVWLG